MIKTRLIKLLSHAKKYIVFQVVWKWISLICQVAMIYSASILLENALFCTVTKQQVLSYGIMVLAFVNLKASLVLLICVPLIPISIVAVQKFAKKLLNKYWGIYTELGDSFLENRQGLTTLKIYQADADKTDEMDEESQRFRQITMKVLTMQLNSTSVMDIIAYGGAAVGMIVILSEFFKGNVNFSGTLMICLLASEFFIPLRLLGSFFHIAMNGMAASDKIFALLDLPEPEEKDGVLEEKQTEIRLEKVAFGYEENRDILKEISMDFDGGSFTSLVGTSGCGKSTIAGILMGRNKGYRGSIRIQGKELRDNLKMGKTDASDEEMYAVLEKVNLLGFLKEQQGLDTLLLERGSNFSGGQCQRLALARALLHDTPVYIFDEATSNIDMESEEMIMEVIRELAKSKTILLISHRLANVVEADRIYMLENGCVVQCGTHNELMKSGRSYAKLYQYQRELESYSQADEKEVAE